MTRKGKVEFKAIDAEVPGWMKLSKRGEAEMRRLAKEIANTVEEAAEHHRLADLPQFTLTGERDLPPQVELTFGMSDDDFDRLVGTACRTIPMADINKMVVGELIRRAIIESVESLPKPPPQRCGNCRWFDRGLCAKALDRSAMRVPDAVVLGDPSIMLSRDGRKCSCHQHRA